MMLDKYNLLSKDIWCNIANKYLINIEIHSLANSCKRLKSWLKNHPRSSVDYIPYEFWNSLIEKLLDYDYSGDECCIHIESVDRGVQDFEYFGQILKQSFPNIKELYFEQSYSFNCKKTFNWELNFIKFISQLQLQFLKIRDHQQGSIFHTFDWDNIMRYMPEYSEYIIESNTCEYWGCPNRGCTICSAQTPASLCYAIKHGNVRPVGCFCPTFS